MNKLKFICKNKNYTDWNVYDEKTLDILDKEKYSFNPVECKVFSNDIIIFDERNCFKKILHSPTRTLKVIPGVLFFDKMYGKTDNNKFYLKVIPDNPQLPSFLVPYKFKTNTFSKKLNNKYIIFRYISWNDKHPIGEIVHTIGDVKELSHFYEYQLYCKNLHTSIKHFTDKTKKALQSYSNEKVIESILNNTTFNMEDRREQHIISIDPDNTKDFDDAFGIQELNEKNTYKLSIYIANVTVWIEFLNLWDSFSERVSTIYLPYRKKTMLPNILGDMFCSLEQNKTRFAFTCDIIIKDNQIIDYSFKNCIIKVHKNYSYSDKAILKNNVYVTVYNVVNNLNTNKKYTYCNTITKTNQVVAYLMTLMNYLTAKQFITYKNGIFRTSKINKDIDILDKQLPQDVENFIMGWNSTGGKYVKFNDCIQHELLKLDAYVHITSPIRRIVDLLNMIIIQKNLGLVNISENCNTFLNKWLSDDMIENINTKMRSIRKIQSQCDILHKCTHNPDIMNMIYNGYIFDRTQKSDGLYQYMVYIPDLNLLNTYISTQICQEYSCHTYKMYLFEDSDTFKKKIMFQLHE